MNILYPKDSLPDTIPNSIFLAGPSVRSLDVESWRPEAISHFKTVGFSGTLLNPENLSNLNGNEYLDQIEWEQEALEKATVIMFWIPRNLETLPGFTTNFELGWWINSGKIVLGAPPEAPKMKYIWHHIKKRKILCSTELFELCNLAFVKAHYQNQFNDEWLEIMSSMVLVDRYEIHPNIAKILAKDIRASFITGFTKNNLNEFAEKLLKPEMIQAFISTLDSYGYDIDPDDIKYALDKQINLILKGK